MAPPPTTTSFFGTASKAMAWSLETIVLPSNFMNGSSTGAEPVAMTMFLAVIWSFRSPVTAMRVGGNERGGAGEDGDLARLGEQGDAADELGDDVVLSFQQRRQVDFDRAELDAVLGGVMLAPRRNARWSGAAPCWECSRR